MALTIDGMVEHPRTLRFDDLMRYPKAEVVSVHQCCGSPLAPFESTRRVCNVRWGGVRLADVLADCLPSAAAQYIWSYGADFDEFSGVVVDAYVKDLPISRVEADVLIGYEMNGSALPAEHGFPARLVVPGFYGTNSVKWLTRMTLAERRAPGPFTTRWYNDPVLNGAGHETRETTPVWSIAPESLIVSPTPHETIELSVEREIWGWAWADGGFAASTSALTTRQHGDAPSSSRRADASGSAFRCAGCRGGAVRWCWLHWRKKWMGCSSRYRGDATQSMACR